MRSLVTLILLALANWTFGENISQIAIERLNESENVISRIETEHQRTDVEMQLVERMKLNRDFVAILSQEEFNDHEVNSLPEFQQFSREILEEQRALVYIVNVMFFIASQVGVSYDVIVEHHTALAVEWNNLINRKQIDHMLAKALVDLTFYKGLNDKYKEQYEI